MVSRARWHHGAWQEAPRRWVRQEGLPGYVLENEFPYLAGDYREDRLADEELRRDVRYALCVPIKNPEHAVLGFFELYRGDSGQPFSWHDAAFLESLANTTAVSIENARLVRELAAKNDEIRTLSAHHVNRLEAERQHIARELHDEAGQALVGVKLSLQAMAHAVPDSLPAIKEPLAQLRNEVNRATARLRTLARRLRPRRSTSWGCTRRCSSSRRRRAIVRASWSRSTSPRSPSVSRRTWRPRSSASRRRRSRTPPTTPGHRRSTSR
ncbi:MAG: histidine kinase [Gemmatimonadaceae bacterium]